jgi:hypothetical protein
MLGHSGAAPRRTSPRDYGVRRERAGASYVVVTAGRTDGADAIARACLPPDATTSAGGRGPSPARACGNVA